MESFVLDDETIRLGELKIKRHSAVNGNGCTEWNGSILDGYGQMTFKGRHKPAHRWAYMLRHRQSNLPTSTQIRRMCGNSKCVDVDHLTAGTARQNTADKIVHGTSNHGWRSIISVDTVRAIKASKNTGTQQERADKLGVAKHMVRNIDSGSSWAWVGLTSADDDKNIASRVTEQSRKRKIAEFDVFSKDDIDKGRAYIEQRVTNTGNKTECWVWKLGKTRRGYGSANFKKHCFAHKLSFICFTGHVPSAGMMVRHMCRAKACCSPSHLELGTAKENAKDRTRDGTQTRKPGEKNHNSSISDDNATMIKLSVGDGTQQQRADRFGVSRSLVSNIDAKLAWKHI